MASAQEIEKELKQALTEIGRIIPWFDDEVNEWGFSHELYPVECGGSSPEEVIEKYPLYLKEFIKERMKGNLNPLVEKSTKGKGGYRPGAGRPKGSVKEPKKRIYIPEDIANWFEHYPNACQDVRRLIRRTT
jgi:hypothetical protein